MSSRDDQHLVVSSALATGNKMSHHNSSAKRSLSEQGRHDMREAMIEVQQDVDPYDLGDQLELEERASS